MDPELRRKNARTAWLIAAFVLLMFMSSVPFWRGLFSMMAGGGGG